MEVDVTKCMIWNAYVVKTKTMVLEKSQKRMMLNKRLKMSKALYILKVSLHGIMTFQKTYKDYSRNSSVQRVTIYMERQWDND